MPSEDVEVKITADIKQFKDAMSEASDKAKDFSKDTDNADKSTKSLSKTISDAKDSFKGIFDNIGLEGFTESLGKGLKDIKGSFEGLGLSSKAATVATGALVVAAVGLIGKLIVKVTKKVYGFAKNVTTMFDPALVEQYTTKMNASFTKLKTTLGAVLEPLFIAMTTIATWVSDAFTGILETVLKIYAVFVGFLGLSGTLSRDATDYADSMEEASASADAGLASFDKLNTLDTSGMGDAQQAQNIRDMMADAALSGEKLRDSIAEAINPAKILGDIFASMGLSEQWNDFAQAGIKAWNKITKIGEKSWGAIVSATTNLWDYVKTIGEDVWNNFVNIVTGIWDLTIETLKDLTAPIVSIFSGIWTAVFKIFTGDFNGAIESVKNGFKGAFESISSFGENMLNKLEDVGNRIFSGWAKTISDIFGGVDLGNIADGFVGGVKTALNAIINMWNNSVANLGFEIEIPSWLGGGTWGVNTYGWKLPTLASGTVAEPNDPFMAIIGDNKSEKEVVSPLSTIEKAVRNVVGEGGQTAKIELTVNLDGRKIARGTYDYLFAEAKRRGEAWH